MKKRAFSLDKIYFYLADGCNLRCRHCWIAPRHLAKGDPSLSLSLNLFRYIIEQAKPLGLTSVKLTGGEPLLHPQIDEILEEIRVLGLRLIVETNGTLCTEHLARRMAACRNPFVSVSLDGVDAETHEWMRGVEGSFDRAVEGVRNLIRSGLKPQIIMTLMRRNIDQIEDIISLAESLGCHSVKFNALQPISRGEAMHGKNETLDIGELVKTGAWVENCLVPSAKIRIYYSHPLAFRPLGRMFGEYGSCGTCGILGILGVLADGSYALCGIGESVEELVFGRAAEDALEDIWENTPLLKMLREGLPDRLEGVCGECLMKNYCLGSCVAYNYYITTNFFAPFWYCKEARQRGLFPESRLRPKSEKKEDEAVYTTVP